MPVLTIISALMTLIKIVIQFVEFLHQHPEIGEGLKGQLGALKRESAETSVWLTTEYDRRQREVPEAP